jgi:hypothetical protein
MYVLAVVEEDGHSWQFCGFTPALGSDDFAFPEKMEVGAISGTHYAPVRCTSKLREIWSRIKALMGRAFFNGYGKDGAENAHSNFLCLCTGYWSRHMVAIQDTDFLDLCEESRVFGEPKV